jgi:hypothetical protein
VQGCVGSAQLAKCLRRSSAQGANLFAEPRSAYSDSDGQGYDFCTGCEIPHDANPNVQRDPLCHWANSLLQHHRRVS